jgi:hypothetical protein
MDDPFVLPNIWAAPLSQGWSVFPLQPRGKKPLCEWKKFQVERASIEQVREWTKRECNIGIVTGRISKIVVLDLDSEEAIAEAKRLGLPHTSTVRTGKGLHVYFRHPGSFDVPNATGIFLGADIRGDGGYVVGPGSVHANGKVYTWATPPGLYDFAPLPEWLFERLKPGAAQVLAERIRNAPPGTRNNTLNRVAFEAARMAARHEIDGPDARRRLVEAAMDAGLDHHEILPTLGSGWRGGLAAEFVQGISARLHPKPAPRFDWVSGSIMPVLGGQWIIKGFLPREGMGVVYGRPGCGKSFVVLDISLCIAAGVDWRGLKTKCCPVSYIASEGGGAFANRVVSWCGEYGVPCPPGFRFSTVMLNLRSDETDALALIQDVQQNQSGCGLVIIDTLSRNIAGGNENAAEDMGAFVNLCDRISKELGCLVLIVHHTGKDEARGARGHSLLLGAVSTEIEITRKQGEPGAIKVTKQRDGTDGAEYGFVLKATTVGVDEDGDIVTCAVAIETDAPKERPRPQGRVQHAVYDAFSQYVLDHGAPNPAGTGFPDAGRVRVVDCEAFVQFAAGRVTAASPSEAKKIVRRSIHALVQRRVLAMNGGKLWSLS